LIPIHDDGLESLEEGRVGEDDYSVTEFCHYWSDNIAFGRHG